MARAVQSAAAGVEKGAFIVYLSTRSRRRVYVVGRCLVRFYRLLGTRWPTKNCCVVELVQRVLVVVNLKRVLTFFTLHSLRVRSVRTLL